MQAIDRQIERRLQERGVRYTQTRRKVAAALLAADGPRSAGELLADVGNVIPLSSLYRSLTVLEEAGVLQPHHAARGLTRYEPAEWLTGHHHHVICVNCGRVEDIQIAPGVEKSLERLILSICRDSGFEAINHSLEIEGRCRVCR